MTKKVFLFIISLISCQTFVFGQVVVGTENFDATLFPPAGWSIKPAITPTNVWIRQTAPITNPSTTAHSAPAVARFRSRNVAAGTKQILVSRTLDYSNRGTSAANISFWMYRDSLLIGNPDSLTVWVSQVDTLDASATWLGTIARNRNIAIPDTQNANGWYQYTYAIPTSFGGTSTRIIFEGTGQSAVVNSGANIYIDDVNFDEFPSLCTGTPNAGTIVNSNPVICNGGGVANLTLSSPITGVLGISYTWQQSNNAGGPWVNTGTNAATLNTGMLTSSTFYQCVVDCSYSGLSYTTPVDSVMVFPNLPPVVNVSPTTASYCAGDTMGVQVIAAGANTYAWLPVTGVSNPGLDTVNIIPVSTTTYVVTGTDANGCTGTASVTITFNNLPPVNITANPNDSVCIGDQVILTSVPTPTTGNIYLWSDGKTTRRDTVLVTGNAVYWVQVTNAAGCQASDTISLVAFPPDTAHFGYTQTGNTIVFSDSSHQAVSWTWTFGDGNGSFNQNPTYTYSAPGTYTVTLIIEGANCNDDTTTQVIIIGPESVDQWVETLGLHVYPNPVSDQLTIRADKSMIDKVEVYSSLGEKVWSDKFSNMHQILIPVNRLSHGCYGVKVYTSKGEAIMKFVRQ